MTKQLLKQIIDSNEQQIIAINAALTALSAGVQSYRLDTGQTVTQVTRYDIDKLKETLDSLIAQNCIYNNRLNGSGGTLIGRPSC